MQMLYSRPEEFGLKIKNVVTMFSDSDTMLVTRHFSLDWSQTVLQQMYLRG